MADPAEKPTPEQPAFPKRTGPQPNWMTSGGPAPVGRGKALFVGLLLIVAVAGVLLGVLLVPARPVSAYLVSVPFTVYDDSSLPPVAFAEQDTKRLVECFPGNSENAYNAGELEPLRNKLKAIAEGRIRLEPGGTSARRLEDGQPFIFHVVGHAAIADDAVHLLPLKADLDDPRTWLPLAEILRALADCPTKKKLLLLDLGRSRTNPFLGPLSDEVTPKLHEWLGRKRNELPCPVIVSCSPNEESLVIPQVGSSSFAFYLAEGLRGAADGYGSAAVDGKVKVREIAEFVRVRTARWARQNRDVPQLTKLFEPPDFTDFDLVLDVPPPVVEDPEPMKYPFVSIGVGSGWSARGALPIDDVRRAGPQLARWAATVIRAEQVYSANPADSRVGDAVGIASEWWEEVRTASRGGDRVAHRSLAGTAWPAPPSGTPPPPDPARLFLTALDRFATAALPKPGVKIDETAVVDRRAELEMAAKDLPAAVAAKLIGSWFFTRFPENSQPGSEDFQFALRALELVLRNDNSLYVEVESLRFVHSLTAGPFERPESRATLLKFLRLESIAAAALNHGSAEFRWVHPFLVAAAEARWHAEQKLSRASSRADVEDADRAIEDAATKFREVDARFAAVIAARAAVEDGLRTLAGTALSQAEFEWPISTERDAVAFVDWTELARNTQVLADELYREPLPSWEIATFRKATRDVTDLLRRFARDTDATAVKRFVDGAASARPIDLRRYRAALYTEQLAGPDRGKVWDAAEAIAERLHVATRKDADLLENESRTITKPPTLPAPRPDGRIRRAEVGVRLLEAGGHPAATKLRSGLDGLRRLESTEQWRALASGLRGAWSRETIAKLLRSDAGLNPDRQERLARAIPSGLWQDAPDDSTATDWRIVPARRREQDEAAWRSWLAAEYRKYATVRTDVRGATARFQNAALAVNPKMPD